MNFKDLLNPKSDTFKIAIAVVSILILIGTSILITSTNGLFYISTLIINNLCTNQLILLYNSINSILILVSTIILILV